MVLASCKQCCEEVAEGHRRKQNVLGALLPSGTSTEPSVHGSKFSGSGETNIGWLDHLLFRLSLFPGSITYVSYLETISPEREL